jgi:FkbM family methyltransferase
MSLPAELAKSRRELESFSMARARTVDYGAELVCFALGTYPVVLPKGEYSLAHWLALTGYWEPWVSLAVIRFTKPGMHCVDIGANYGYYTVMLSRLVENDGKVLAFEPHPTTYNILGKTLAANGALNVTACQIAIGDQLGESDMLCFDAMPSGNCLRKYKPITRVCDAFDLQQESCTVRVAPLDAVLPLEWKRLDLVKVDCEGAELAVWRGAKRVRERFASALWIVEVHCNEHAKTLLDEIVAEGYVLRLVDTNGDLQQIGAQQALQKCVAGEPVTLWLTRS